MAPYDIGKFGKFKQTGYLRQIYYVPIVMKSAGQCHFHLSLKGHGNQERFLRA